MRLRASKASSSSSLVSVPTKCLPSKYPIPAPTAAPPRPDNSAAFVSLGLKRVAEEIPAPSPIKPAEDAPKYLPPSFLPSFSAMSSISFSESPFRSASSALARALRLALASIGPPSFPNFSIALCWTFQVIRKIM